MKTAVILLAIPDIYFSAFERIYACKETSYVKVSILYKWRIFMSQILFFFFEWVIITIK